ncbi:MAG: 2-amino-4-hydroxy-6-hydroxymethyldihydropteridine diphosphokinase [Bacillota bacterium]|nr:2-amino-4-hydroxy-6-hydroxymethyldihydropteridine diphosphokinase [Bacillota bacterium]
MAALAYLGLGSNLGDRRRNIADAVKMLAESGHVRIEKVSSLYETEPVGYTEQGRFLNAVAGVTCDMPPLGLLSLCQAIEARLGRERTVRWGPRTIDIDILLYFEGRAANRNETPAGASAGAGVEVGGAAGAGGAAGHGSTAGAGGGAGGDDDGDADVGERAGAGTGADADACDEAGGRAGAVPGSAGAVPVEPAQSAQSEWPRSRARRGNHRGRCHRDHEDLQPSGDDLDGQASAGRLEIPHPRMWERGFVIVPLAEIAPDLKAPNGCSASDLAQDPRIHEGVSLHMTGPWWREGSGGEDGVQAQAGHAPRGQTRGGGV